MSTPCKIYIEVFQDGKATIQINGSEVALVQGLLNLYDQCPQVLPIICSSISLHAQETGLNVGQMFMAVDLAMTLDKG